MRMVYQNEGVASGQIFRLDYAKGFFHWKVFGLSDGFKLIRSHRALPSSCIYNSWLPRTA